MGVALFNRAITNVRPYVKYFINMNVGKKNKLNYVRNNWLPNYALWELTPMNLDDERKSERV